VSENAIPDFAFREPMHITLPPLLGTPVRSNKAEETAKFEDNVKSIGTKSLDRQVAFLLDEGRNSLQEDLQQESIDSVESNTSRSPPKTSSKGQLFSSSAETLPSPIKGEEVVTQDWDWTTEW
jgi:hypothetical protein